MKNINTAFILAAGFGTRLKPFTDNLPKALVEYKGKPMIENVITRLKAYGVTDFYINTHHFAEKMEEYFANRAGDERIKLIYENEILGTGGALKNAAKYLSAVESFILYNTDVDTEIDLNEFENFHSSANPMATLCVQDRKTSRYLICNNEEKIIIGRTENGKNKFYLPDNLKHNGYLLRAFCGIHLINSSIFNYLSHETNSFDIIPFYMKLIEKSEKIRFFDVSGILWKDLGVPENL
ncbi:MAG: NTP transferase domain-containing protein [Ignavibacteria bacterium]|nr:NTP transferase domain-containing protein [Ignavibacteria bacterium]